MESAKRRKASRVKSLRIQPTSHSYGALRSGLGGAINIALTRSEDIIGSGENLGGGWNFKEFVQIIRFGHAKGR